MAKGYHHLTREQRCQLCTLKATRESIDKIALIVGVHRSTVYRELSRNRGKRDYRYQQAHEKASKRSQNSHVNKRKITAELISKIKDKL